MTPQTIPDNSRLVDALLNLPIMYGGYRGRPGGRK